MLVEVVGIAMVVEVVEVAVDVMPVLVVLA